MDNQVNTDINAETRALWLLRENGFSCIQQLDWIGKDSTGKWTIIEVKDKELFKPGPNFPYWGAGWDESQRYLRRRLLKDLGLRTYLIVFAKGTNNVYGGYADELDNRGCCFDTPRGIRIYPINSYTELEWPKKQCNTHQNAKLGGEIWQVRQNQG